MNNLIFAILPMPFLPNFQIFYSLLRKKEEKVNHMDARSRFKNLPIEKKVKYIRKSAKHMMKTLEDLKEKQNHKHEEDEEDTSNMLEAGKVKGPSKDEVDIYLK